MYPRKKTCRYIVYYFRLLKHYIQFWKVRLGGKKKLRELHWNKKKGTNSMYRKERGDKVGRCKRVMK